MAVTRTRTQPELPRPPAGRTAGTTATIDGVRITHADRVLYEGQGTTKRDLAVYYQTIGDWILPHVIGRPTTLLRCPDGTHAECFYQKHVGRYAPSVIPRVSIQEKTKVGEYLMVDSLRSLIALVQMGILEIHTWNSVHETLEQPDRVVFDLDPGPGVGWSDVVEAARRIRLKLEGFGLASFVKTTGGKGLHVMVPFRRGPTWDDCVAFTRAFAVQLAAEDPRRLTAVMSKSERGGRIFIDYLRNVRGATSVAAYSTRARSNAPISVPLGWDELGRLASPEQHTIETVPRRVARLARDPWHDYFEVRQKLPTRSADVRARSA